MSKGLSPVLLETTRKTLDAWRDFIIYLQFPQWATYRAALYDTVFDAKRAIQSSSHLLLLTFRPLFLLALLIGRYLWALLRTVAKHGWVILRVVGKQLFYHAFVSARKGVTQLQTASRWLIRWQKSLSRTWVFVELGAIIAIILLYLLRRYIIQQKYVARFKTSFKRTKRRMLQSYQRAVHRIAKVSIFLAMLLPHVIFGGFVVIVKTLFSSVLHWLACETYATSLISWWYPLFCTIATTYQLRTLVKEASNDRPDEQNADESVTIQSPKHVDSNASRGTKTGVFPHTTPRREGATRPLCATPIQRWMQSKETSSESTVTEHARFWLTYWVVYMVFMALARICYLTPIFGRIFYKSRFWKSAGAEFQLMFFLWIFGLPAALTSSAKTEKDFDGYEARPLQLLLRHVSPNLVSFQEQVSHAVPPAYWEQVLARSRNALDLLLLVRLISKDFHAWLLHVVEESHALVLPSITLLMPGFVTGYGVVYVQAIAPAAKSCKALNFDGLDSLGLVRINLEYWILNLLLAAFLEWLSPLLWWVPLSTHVTYLLWCHLSLPKTIEHWYNTFDQELQAFGILPRDENTQLSMTETRTAQFLRALAQTLPKGVDNPKDSRAELEANGSKEDESFSDALTQPANERYNDHDSPRSLKPDRDIQMQPNALKADNQVSHSRDETLGMGDSARGKNFSAKIKQAFQPEMNVMGMEDEGEASSSVMEDNSQSESRLRRSTRTRRRPDR